MIFEWDEDKNSLNRRKHGIDFSDVPMLFTREMVTMRDSRFAYDEERWIGLG